MFLILNKNQFLSIFAELQEKYKNKNKTKTETETKFISNIINEH